MKKFNEFLLITMGTLITAAGIYFFKIPNNFSTGGVSGISVIMSGIFKNISVGTYIMIINISLLIIGFMFFGKSFGAKTVYCSLLLSFFIYGFEKIFPMTKPLTDDPLLELVFATIFPAAGSAILFNYGASTGGTDVIAMIIKKYSKQNISKSLMFTDAIIVFATFFVFAISTWLFSMLGFFTRIFVINNVIESINISKYFTIVTTHEEEITNFISKELHKGVTVSRDFYGGFTGEEKSLILTALTRHQAILLRNYIKTVDPKAFIIINNTSSIIGKGFRECI